KEWCGRITHSTSARTNPGHPALFAGFRSFALGSRVEVQIESKFRECFERYGEKETVFFYARVIPYHSTERGHPGGEIAVNRIALFLEEAGRGFNLFLTANAPIIVEAIIPTNYEQTTVLEKGITV